MLKNILFVGLGGFVGSVVRYLVYLASTSNGTAKTLFPWGTFLVNIIGCLIIGILWGMLNKYNWLTEELRLLLMVGFCGGFTTFSSYALDSIVVGKENLFLGISYLLTSIVIGILCVFLGYNLTKLL